MSSSLIKSLYSEYDFPKIDLLVNNDTLPIAKIIPFVHNIHVFSYLKKNQNRWTQEKKIVQKIFKKYDLSINLTSSDRSVLYSILSGKISISAIESNRKKAWWKKILLTHYYYYDKRKHILLNNLQPLDVLKIKYEKINHEVQVSKEVLLQTQKKLENLNINNFVIFHPSAQYKYKIYPESLRNELLKKLNTLGVKILITGSNNKIDNEIKKQIPNLKNLINLIGKTSLEEYFALSKLSLAYIGMDTLNMHIAASQNKRIFAIFGPTNLKMWSPWSNELHRATNYDQPIQTYSNITIFQGNFHCVACGQAGCNNNHQISECLKTINPQLVFNKVESWVNSKEDKSLSNSQTSSTYHARKFILFIVYGDDDSYYDGAKFSILTLQNWIKSQEKIEIVVLTEKPSKFSDSSLNIIQISNEQIFEWSLGGKYHFRIKNRGLSFVMESLGIVDDDKILFFDTDTYFHESPLPLFNLITSDQAVMYLNEGLIYSKKRFSVYIQNLKNKKIFIDNKSYELTKKSPLWGSLMIGIKGNMRQTIEWSDKLLVKLFDIVPAHTIEEFALSESLLMKYKIVEGKKYVSLYSTSRKKEYARNVLANFFEENSNLNKKEQINIAQNVKIKRPLFVLLKQRFLRLFSNNEE